VTRATDGIAVSIVVPAHNEARLLPATLEALAAAVGSIDLPTELIVVDDASTDETAAIAAAAGARVISVEARKISAVRNAGAREAAGRILIFVDADTIVPAAALGAAVSALEDGAVGGGTMIRFDDETPWHGRVAVRGLNLLFRIIRLAPGCFVFCRRDTFETIGGFDETLYASEEVRLSSDLRKHGRFVMLHEPVVTSGRKLRMYPLWTMIALCLRTAVRPRVALTEPHPLWYEGRREE